MNQGALEKYFEYMAAQVGFPDDGRLNHVKRAIDLGLAEFWNRYPWSFRSEDDTIDTSTEAETYDLPDDFGGIGTLREKDSAQGTDITYKTKAEFDADFPNPTSHTASYPKFFTIYRDKTEKVWKIKFFPIPSITPIYMQYFTDKVDIEEVPKKYSGGVCAFVGKYLFPLGSEGRTQAIIDAGYEIKQLQADDSPFDALPFRFMDGTEAVVSPWRPWV